MVYPNSRILRDIFVSNKAPLIRLRGLFMIYCSFYYVVIRYINGAFTYIQNKEPIVVICFTVKFYSVHGYRLYRKDKNTNQNG